MVDEIDDRQRESLANPGFALAVPTNQNDFEKVRQALKAMDDYKVPEATAPDDKIEKPDANKPQLPNLGSQNEDPVKLQKRIHRLIEQLADNDFAVRTKAQAELVKVGFASFNQLEKANKSEDAEMAKRATQAQKQIREEIGKLIAKLSDKDPKVQEQAQALLVRFGYTAVKELEAAHASLVPGIKSRTRDAWHKIGGERPSEYARLEAARNEGLVEIGGKGAISPITHRRYQELIETIDLGSPSKAELEWRCDFFRERAGYARQVPSPKDEIVALRRGEELEAMSGRATLTDRARLDYVDLLVKAGDKDRAISVLADAIKHNPKLQFDPSFRTLARDSGAVSNKAFAEAIDKTTGKHDFAKQLQENEPDTFRDRMDHLSHETFRFGTLPRLNKEWRQLIDSLDQRAQKETKFFRYQHWLALETYAAHLTRSGDSLQANKVLVEMIKLYPGSLDVGYARRLDWMTRLNDSHKNKDFLEAERQAKEVLKKKK